MGRRCGGIGRACEGNPGCGLGGQRRDCLERRGRGLCRRPGEVSKDCERMGPSGRAIGRTLAGPAPISMAIPVLLLVF